jgi:phage baseplate assembly protein W
MTDNIYRGISFMRYKDRKTLTLSGVDLVKQDLINHIYTRWRERIMMPKFGTRVPDMPFEPMTRDLLDNLESDLRRVVEYDPRVQLRAHQYTNGIRITPLYEENVVVASIDLWYVELDLSETLDITLEFGK